MNKVYDYLLKDLQIKYGDSVVVGTSGGPDSMCLLHLLLRIKQALDIQIICAHVNHNSGRPGQIEDQKFVERYCKKNGIVFETMIIEEYGDDNFHNEARSIRYNFFSKLAKKYNSKYIFTAHHADDLMETILMRIVRGSTLRGYSGFSKIVKMDDYTVVRPLIHVTKQQILTYLKDNKVKYVIDTSNDKDIYTRNRFRKYIVPEFRKEDPLVHEKFYKFSKVLLEYNEYIDKQVSRLYKKVCPDNVLNIDEFLRQEQLIQTKIIYLMLEKIYQDDLMLLTDKHSEIILNLINSKKANSTIHLPNNIQAIKSYNTLELTKLNIKDIYEIQISDYVNLPNGKNIEIIKSSKIDDNNICRIDLSAVKQPLYVRNRQTGDKMTVKGMLGRKKISDIFIDCKIPMEQRDLWPVVCDANDNIIWLPGLKKSKFCKAKDEKCDIILKYY